MNKDWLLFLLILTVFGLVLWGALYTYDRMESQRERWLKARAEFLDKMARDGCKRTSFAGRYAEPVWTCPDGMAYLEP